MLGHNVREAQKHFAVGTAQEEELRTAATSLISRRVGDAVLRGCPEWRWALQIVARREPRVLDHRPKSLGRELVVHDGEELGQTTRSGLMRSPSAVISGWSDSECVVALTLCTATSVLASQNFW